MTRIVFDKKMNSASDEFIIVFILNKYVDTIYRVKISAYALQNLEYFIGVYFMLFRHIHR